MEYFPIQFQQFLSTTDIQQYIQYIHKLRIYNYILKYISYIIILYHCYSQLRLRKTSPNIKHPIHHQHVHLFSFHPGVISCIVPTTRLRP